MSVARIRGSGAASQSVGGSISIVTCINLGRVYEMETMKLTINSEKKKKDRLRGFSTNEERQPFLSRRAL